MSTVTTPQTVVSNDQNLAKHIKDIADQKRGKKDALEKGRMKNLNEWIIVGGDVFSFGYLGFQTAQIAKPALKAIPVVKDLSMGFGIVGGVINIGVGTVCLIEACKALKVKDYKVAARLFSFWVGLTGIGVIMILTSLAARVSILAPVAAVFHSRRWLLPSLFFLCSLPLIGDLSQRMFHIARGTDQGSKFSSKNSQEREGLIHSDDPYFGFQEILKEKDETKIRLKLSERLDALQAEIGVQAAIESFEVIQAQLKGDEAKAQEHLQTFKKKIRRWKVFHGIRSFQQALCVGSFGMSVGAHFSSALRGTTAQIVQNSFLAGENLIPSVVDTVAPFERNVPMVVDSAVEKSAPQVKTLHASRESKQV